MVKPFRTKKEDADFHLLIGLCSIDTPSALMRFHCLLFVQSA